MKRGRNNFGCQHDAAQSLARDCNCSLFITASHGIGCLRARKSGTLFIAGTVMVFCPGIISRPTKAFQSIVRRKRSAALQTSRQATGTTAAGTITVNRATSGVAGMGEVLVPAGPRRLSA